MAKKKAATEQAKHRDDPNVMGLHAQVVEQPICDTLENADYLVPALIYRLSVTHSPKFKRLLPVLNQVPGRTGIRFHRGTKPEHSRGCILVSAENEQKLTALWLKEQNDHEETRIDICQPKF